MITLSQFRFSHYCEKVRWALDYKGLGYVPKNLLPGSHARIVQELGLEKTSVPVIIDGENVVQDSTRIISFLDQHYPGRSLTPQNANDGRKALEWEEYLDEEIGIPLRLWFYYHLFSDPERALRFLTAGTDTQEQAAFTPMFPTVSAAMIRHLDIHADSAARAEERLRAALGRLNEVLRIRRFLVGDRFSRADLTACALLLSFCAPGKTDAEFAAAYPEPVCMLRDRLKTHRFFGWVTDNYANYRRPARTTT